MRTICLIVLWSAAVLGAATPAPPAAAQAYCALRDPVHQVYELFPKATSYRSIIRSVDDTHRAATAQRLPFTLHFNELGRHTLYVALQEGRPLGLVHVRSEAGRWGLVEIAWGLTLDLQVTGYRFQRCRDAGRDQVESRTITQAIVGRRFEDLRELLDAPGQDLAPQAQALALGPAAEGRRLLVTTLRSALKTIAVTDLVWAADLRQLRMIQQGLSAFPNAASVELVHAPYGHNPHTAALKMTATPSSGIDRAGVTALLIRNAAGDLLGLRFETPWSAGGQHARIWWTVASSSRALIAVHADASVQTAFEALRGRRQEDFGHCATAAELAGKEALSLANACLNAATLPQEDARP